MRQYVIFLEKAKPLYDLLSTLVKTKVNKKLFKKIKSQKPSGEPINWTNKHQSIFKNLIETIKFSEVMAYLDFSLPLIVHCDASESGLEAVLYQK